MDELILRNMIFYGYHGCYKEEQTIGQEFHVDVWLRLDLSKAGKSDSLTDTVDYVAVAGTVRSIVEGKPKLLIESVAENIASAILEGYNQVDSLTVSVHKPSTPLGVICDDVSVKITRKRT